MYGAPDGPALQPSGHAPAGRAGPARAIGSGRGCLSPEGRARYCVHALATSDDRSGWRGFLRRRALARKLKALQTKYYTASAKDDAVILEYLATLGELRALSTQGQEKRTRVHLGCGDHRLEGWWNADLLPSASTDVLANFEQALPFRSGSVDFLHSEDLLTATLQRIGFRVRSCRYNESVHAEFRYLDLRNFGLSISLEAEKPRT